MIGNSLLSVGAVFLFKDELVTVVKLTAARVYFTLPGDDKPCYVSYDTFLSRAEVPATCGTSTGRVSCASPNPAEMLKGSVGIDLAKEPDQSVTFIIRSYENTVHKGASPVVESLKATAIPAEHIKDSENSMIIMARTPQEALKLASDAMQPPRRPGKATMAKLKAKWEKRFSKDLRYGSRKAKVTAKRVLGL